MGSSLPTLGASNPVPKAGISAQTHAAFDIEKLSGGKQRRWYEIARVRNKFQAECTSMTHDITPSSRGLLLETVCYDAERIPTATSMGQLFAPNPNDYTKLQLKYLNERYGSKPIDFWIYNTDYDNFLVCGNQSGLAWIFSAEPYLSICAFHNIIDDLKAKGFDMAPDNVQVKYKYLAGCDQGVAPSAYVLPAEYRTKK